MKLTKLNENKTLAEYEKEWEEQNGKTCDKCGTKLNDGGTCPKCDDGEEDSLKEGASGTNSEEFDSYAAAIERHKANGTENELDAVITSAHNDLNSETRLTGLEFNKLCDLANLPDRKIAVREAYDPQEFNPDARGPIYDMNVQFYSDLDKAIEEKRWEDAAREYCSLNADLCKELESADKKPFIGKLFRLFAIPHQRVLGNYRKRIPAEYIEACENCTNSLDEDMINKFYIDEIVPAQGGKTETERHSFDTLEELKQYVKDANLTEDDIATCGGCDVKDLCEDIEKLHTKSNGEYLVKADSGKGYTVFNGSDVAIGGIDNEDADSDDVAIHKFKCNEYSESLDKSDSPMQLDKSNHYEKDYEYDDEFTLNGY